MPTLKSYTFAIRSSQHTIPKLQKESAFANAKPKRTKKASREHCINVMRVKVPKLNELNINKHSGKPKVKCFYSRTTLIRYRSLQAEKPTAQSAHLVFADTKANASKKPKELFLANARKRIIT